MKNLYTYLFVILMSMTYVRASAHDFEMQNSDGVTIYYNYTDGSTGSSVYVIYRGSSYSSYSNEYSRNVAIPKTVTYNSKTYSVTGIGDYAFYDCDGLTSVTIPNSVTRIGYEAFQYCSGLTSVTIPNSVTSIGGYAFSDCRRLISIIIGSNVTSIGFSAFKGTPWYENQDDGVVYAGNVAYRYKGTMPNNTSVVLKEGTTVIGSSAFSGCSGLTSVTIPNSVTSIGNSAFNGCSGMTSLTIGNSVTSIGDYAFNGCSGMTSLTIGNSVTSIGNCAFECCSGLTSVTIPNSVTSIGYDAFKDCNGLTSVTIGNSVTTIGVWAFNGCSGLASVTIGESVTSIGDYAFNGCYGLKSVTWNAVNYPDFSSYSSNPFYNIRTQITKFNIGENVTGIPAHLCYGMKALTSVSIPDSVTSIGEKAFEGCSGLKLVTWNAVNYPDFSSYSSNPFYNIRSQITIFNIGKNVTRIPPLLCYGMEALTWVTIPNSVTSIGAGAFNGCRGMTSLTIGNSVTSIGDYAFNGCYGLKSVTWNAVNYPDFSSYSSNPFYNIRTQITEFNIGENVTGIPAHLCYGMKALTSVSIPDSVTSIGEKAFEGCSGLKLVTWNAVNYPDFSSYSSNPFYNIRTQITKFNIGKNVTKMPAYLCYGMKALTSVSIPDSVTSIGESAFEGCSGLKSVTISRSVTSIGEKSFYYCSGLTSVTIPDSVTSIGEKSFYYCSGLTSVTIPDSVTSIGGSAFEGCSGLKSVTIGKSVTTIGDWAFSYNMGVTSITIPNSVTTIGESAFLGCTRLVSVAIPENVMEIGNSVFSYCTSLTSVTIPNSVTNIGNSTFEGCTDLTSITCHAVTPPKCSDSTFLYVKQSECTLYVPSKRITAYKNADVWKNFNIVGIKPIYNKGDANGDSQIDVADFTAIANFILGSIPENFEEDAADVNKDEIVNVADITGVANIILYGSLNSSAAAKGIGGMEYRIPVMQAKDFAISAGGEYVMDIDIENPDMQFSACQFDVHLPKGISIKSVTLGKERTTLKKTNYLDFATLANGTTRVICASTKDIAFAGTEGTVAKLTVVADDGVEAGSYDVTIDNIVLSKAGDMAKPESVTINADISSATGISEIKTAEPNSADGMYDILGRRISSSEKLREGIYIIGGKKVIK